MALEVLYEVFVCGCAWMVVERRKRKKIRTGMIECMFCATMEVDAKISQREHERFKNEIGENEGIEMDPLNETN